MDELEVTQCWLTLILSAPTAGPKRVTAVSNKLQIAISALSITRQTNKMIWSSINTHKSFKLYLPLKDAVEEDSQ